MKIKYISIFIVLFSLIVSFSVLSFAQTYQPYASVTEDSSQVKILQSAIINDPAFDMFGDYLIMRTADREYYGFFNIDGNEASYYRYYAIQSGNQIQWYLDRDDTSDFSYTINPQYTSVGSVYGSLHSKYISEHIYYIVFIVCALFITILSLFKFIRIHKRSGGVEL